MPRLPVLLVPLLLAACAGQQSASSYNTFSVEPSQFGATFDTAVRNALEAKGYSYSSAGADLAVRTDPTALRIVESKDQRELLKAPLDPQASAPNQPQQQLDRNVAKMLDGFPAKKRASGYAETPGFGHVQGGGY